VAKEDAKLAVVLVVDNVVAPTGVARANAIEEAEAVCFVTDATANCFAGGMLPNVKPLPTDLAEPVITVVSCCDEADAPYADVVAAEESPAPHLATVVG